MYNLFISYMRDLFTSDTYDLFTSYILYVNLQENVHLSSCNLSWNGFSELGGVAIADALLINTNLKEIDISSNRLTYNVAVRIAKAIATNEVLEVLKVGSMLVYNIYSLYIDLLFQLMLATVSFHIISVTSQVCR